MRSYLCRVLYGWHETCFTKERSEEMNGGNMKRLNVLSRLLISAIFVVSGLGKAANFSQTTQMMGNLGFPIPSLFLAGAIVVELGGGFLLLLGYQTRLAAIALALFLIPTTLIFHAGQMIEVLKNVAIIGGLLKVVLEGAGSLSIDSRTRLDSVQETELRKVA
jgi:putative oxidoreductase